ncbi:hypothetical protein F5Y18DRAFT_10006 [Xylariaceae sp. FL1019]|nr:hypothetical protein F5Y18DRAFT_10006 [Xylariaceae sp. FL1019]
MSGLSKFKSFYGQYYPPGPKPTAATVLPALGSQEGRVFIVTGGNAGIGFELCKLLYRTGAKIYMASRSEVKAKAAIQSIADGYDEPGKGQLKFLHLDLNDLDIVQSAARDFSQQESKLDVLWNNAGTGGNIVNYGERTAQGFEPLMGMHCIATLLFTQLLTPLLAAASRNSPPGSTRVLWLGTNLVDTSAPPNGIDFAMLDRGSKDGAKNYAASKAGTWMLAYEYGRRHVQLQDGILSLMVNPGNVKAGSYAGTPRLLLATLNATMLHDTANGAYTELFAGLSSTVKMDDWVNCILPWGRVGDIKLAWRQDIVRAMKPEDEGGLGYGKKFWEWCETQWGPHAGTST